VHEIPSPQRALLALHDQQRLAGEHEEVLLIRLPVVHRHRLGRPEDEDVQPELQKLRLAFEVADRTATFRRAPCSSACVEHEPAFALRNKAVFGRLESCLRNHSRPLRIITDVFTVEQRDRVRARILEMAEADARVVAGAEIGALAQDDGDRWSDLDLTFGVAHGASVEEVLEDWTQQIAREFDAAHLFDLPFGTSIYRVFLLPGNLQLDLSFTPAGDFGPRGPKFTLLFGHAADQEAPPQPTAHHVFGLGVHHAVRARICVERARLWQAEYWISALRDQALTLPCLARGLEVSYGRGFDQLPAETLARAEAALVHSLERDELLRALGAAIDLLLEEAGEIRDPATKLGPQLRDLAS
jgi:hypothetical protein